MSDTESYVYRFSWDREDLKTYPWDEHYVKQPEVLAYLNHVVRRHDLRKHMRFHTQMISADWSDDEESWTISVDGKRGPQKVKSTYLITGLGLLSKQNFPDIPGIDDFQGEKHHTAKWPKDLDLSGKKVAVIGCGSTGVQVITELGRKVGEMVSYQRHPQYSVPSADRKFTAEERKYVNEHWDEIFHQVRNSITAFGFKESERSYHDATPEEREKIFEENWQKGNGFRFMFGTFNDIAVDAEANEGACEFIRKKIGEIVTDPEKARKLKPDDVYARRPLCDGNASSGQRYFAQFNRPNVDIVHLGENPISQIEANGIRTADGVLHEHDVIIFATGFDAVEGNYTRINIHGRNGLSLKDSWEETGPTAYLGFIVPEFPNLFMISGPKGPFTNIPPAIESQIEFISEAVKAAGSKPMRPIEPTREAEREWSEECERLASKSLFWNAAVSLSTANSVASWVGANEDVGQLDLRRQHPRQATLSALLLWWNAGLPTKVGGVCEQWVQGVQAFLAGE